MNDKDHNESSVVTVSEVQPDRPKRGAYFWLSFLAICVSLFMSAIETSGTSTALPTIINELHGDDFVWVGSAYPLAATALLPASGGMAQVFGRRITMLVALALFALGSALCGCAKNMSWLIAARTIQGAGGGALQSLAGIIVSDLVSLEERGTYNSLIGLTWAVAAGIGPLIGGSLAAKGHWRWFFYINLPTSGLAAILVFSFLRLKTPPGSLKEKLGRMDWIGNIIFIGSATSTAIALTWGGITHPWTSAATLIPLIIGLCGLVFFLAYEEIFAIHPIVPFKLLSNRTSLSGYLQTFFTPIVMIATLYYFATYEQSVKGASAIRSGVCFLSMTLVLGVTMIFTGVSITITKVYRVQLWAGWAILMIAMGAFSTITVTTEGWHAILFSGLVGLGCGLLYSAQYFPVLAPLPISENAHALALFSFFRTFASVWAITIGGTILQNQLVKRLPEAFTSQFSSGAALAYASIPAIASLEEPLRSEVRNAFAESIRVIWQVLIGIAAMGMLSSLMMKALPLHTQVDERWGIEEDVNQSQGSTDLGDAELAKKTSLTKDPESIIPQLD